jgi:hypothetical protein
LLVGRLLEKRKNIVHLAAFHDAGKCESINILAKEKPHFDRMALVLMLLGISRKRYIHAAGNIYNVDVWLLHVWPGAKKWVQKSGYKKGAICVKRKSAARENVCPP